MSTVPVVPSNTVLGFLSGGSLELQLLEICKAMGCSFEPDHTARPPGYIGTITSNGGQQFSVLWCRARGQLQPDELPSPSEKPPHRNGRQLQRMCRTALLCRLVRYITLLGRFVSRRGPVQWPTRWRPGRSACGWTRPGPPRLSWRTAQTTAMLVRRYCSRAFTLQLCFRLGVSERVQTCVQQESAHHWYRLRTERYCAAGAAVLQRARPVRPAQLPFPPSH